MFYVRLLLFSILLYNTEARWFDQDYRDENTYPDSRATSNSTITDPVTNSTSTNGNGTDPKPLTFIKSNLTTPIEPKYRLDETETNYTSNTATTLDHSKDNETKPVNDEEESEPYYPDWYNKPKPNGTTTTESPYDGYNETAVDDIQPATKTMKPYDNNDEYGYLTIENGYLTAHFPEASTETKTNSSGVELSKRFNQTTDSKNTTTTTDNFEYGGNKSENSETTTTRRPYYYDWFSTTTRKSPWFTHRYLHTTRRTPHHHSSWGRAHSYNITNVTRDFEITTRRRIISSTILPHWWRTNTTSTRGPYVWWDPTTTTESTNRTYWPEPVYNRTIPVYRTTTDYPYYIRSTSPPSFDESIVTSATSIYGAVADFLKKLAGTILPSGVKIVPNSNITNLALANGNGNTIVYAYNYF